MKLLVVVGGVCACALISLFDIQVAHAQNGAFTDINVNRDPADPNFLILAVSNQAEADRVYDEISGRVLDRFVRGEVGELFPPNAQSQASGQMQARQLDSRRILSGFLSQTHDNFDFSVAGRKISADFDRITLGADAFLNEKYLIGASLSYQTFDGQGGYADSVRSKVEDIAFFEPVFLNGTDQIAATADAISYAADYSIGATDEEIEGWQAVAYGAMELVQNRVLVSGFVSYSDNERTARLRGSVVETLDKEILPEFETLVEQGQITSDFRENRYDFMRLEENDQTTLNASISATYFRDIGLDWNGAFILGAQYVSVDVGDASVRDDFSGSFASTPDFGIGFENPEAFERTAQLPSTLAEDFTIFRAEGMVSYRRDQSIFVPFVRASVRHYSEALAFRSSQWDTFNYTFQEFGTGIEGTATTPNEQQSIPEFDQTFGTLEVGTTIALTPRIRARVNALSEVISNDLDRWGIGISLQRRF